MRSGDPFRYVRNRNGRGALSLSGSTVTTPSEQIEGQHAWSKGLVPDCEDTLPVTCYCEREVVRVPTKWVRLGLTRPCHRGACQRTALSALEAI